jgi:hypothetical protein
LWGEQVEAFDSLVRKRRPRNPDEPYTFSPSKADECLRAIYYDATNAPTDVEPVVAWQERRRRNGDAYHRETQFHYRKMHELLAEAGLGDKAKFVVLAVEISGTAEFTVTLNEVKRTVRLRGRADIVLQYVGETIPGVISKGDVIGCDLKSKDRLKGVNNVKFRFPSYTFAQMTAYTLLRFESKEGEVYENIGNWLVHFESLQKPDKQDEKESKDVWTTVVQPTEDDQRRLLTRLATAVEHIEEKRLPPPELDKCYFCGFKRACQRDGGYQPKEVDAS